MEAYYEIVEDTEEDVWAGIATRYGLDGSMDRITAGASFSAPVQTGHVTHPGSYTIGTGSFRGGGGGGEVAGAWR